MQVPKWHFSDFIALVSVGINGGRPYARRFLCVAKLRLQKRPAYGVGLKNI